MKLALLSLACVLLLSACGGIKGDWKNVNAPERRWQITGDTMTHVQHGTLVAKWKYKWIDEENVQLYGLDGSEIRKIRVYWDGKKLCLDFKDGAGPTELVKD